MQTTIPKHIGIIMDGNRRWAKEKGLPVLEGHRAGYEKAKEIAEACFDRGVTTATFFAFSAENWERPAEEIGYLMKLVVKALHREISRLHQKGIRVVVLGRRDGLSAEVLAGIDQAHDLTKNNTRGTIILAMNYGGRGEIVDAVKKIADEKIPADQVNEEMMTRHMYHPEIPDPDLIIRTSGELRTSGFLLWQAAYAELYFCKTYWPDFSVQDLDEAIEEFGRRQRRFGK